MEQASFKVKKALNPYQCFIKENRARVGVENPGKSFRDIMLILSDMWKSCTPEQH